MKVLVLTKRLYTGKDLLADRYGRLRELPLGLAALGHDVLGVCLSYRQRSEGVSYDELSRNRGAVTWYSFNINASLFPSLCRYFRHVGRLAREFQPDVVWACSDAYHVIFGRRVAERVNAAYAVDLYDNFESFSAARVPGVVPLFRRSLKATNGISCVSRPLARRISEKYGYKNRLEVIENAVHLDLFCRRDRAVCRRELGLPLDARIVGTAGAMSADRGISALFGAFNKLSTEDSNLHLAFAGPGRERLGTSSNCRVHDLGTLPWERVPILLNALDVAVICNLDSPFGRYCFPQKLYEIVACGVPMVATAVGAVEELLVDQDACLYSPGDVDGLVDRIKAQISHPVFPVLAPCTWEAQSKKLEKLLTSATENLRCPAIAAAGSLSES